MDEAVEFVDFLRQTLGDEPTSVRHAVRGTRNLVCIESVLHLNDVLLLKGFEELRGRETLTDSGELLEDVLLLSKVA